MMWSETDLKPLEVSSDCANFCVKVWFMFWMLQKQSLLLKEPWTPKSSRFLTVRDSLVWEKMKAGITLLRTVLLWRHRRLNQSHQHTKSINTGHDSQKSNTGLLQRPKPTVLRSGDDCLFDKMPENIVHHHFRSDKKKKDQQNNYFCLLAENLNAILQIFSGIGI